MPIVPEESGAGPAQDALRILVYSDSGYGKTTLAAAFMSYLHGVTGKKALYCDWDVGDRDLVGDKASYRIRWSPGEQAAVSEAQESIECALREKVSAYVVDTASVMGKQILTESPSTDRAFGPYSFNDAQLAFDQWVLGTFRLSRAGIHVLVLAHEKVGEIKNAKGAVTKVRGGPSIIGNQTIQTLPAAMRLVYRLTVEPSGPTGVTRILIPDAVDDMFLAKDRLNAFALRQKVPFGVSPIEKASNGVGQPKPVEQFENECLKMGEKVWRTVFKAASRRGEAREKASETTQATTQPTEKETQ